MFWVLVVSVLIVTSQGLGDWRGKAIYQILVDRFAKTADTTDGCDNLSLYCGGTFQGIINHLDYIQNMGFDGIWISPVIENTANGYHGYWAQNIYKINPFFGTENDLSNLKTQLNNRFHLKKKPIFFCTKIKTKLIFVFQS